MRNAPPDRAVVRVALVLLAAGAGVWYGSQRAAPEWSVQEMAGVAEGHAEGTRLVERAGQEEARRRRRALPLAPGERIDPNSADLDELQRLPRVGPALAQRIVEHRTERGPFRSLGELREVSGIGPALLEAIAPHVDLPVAPAVPTAGRVVSAGPRATPAQPGPVDINTASAEQLQALPGIGPKLAERIVEERRANGPFRAPDDLERVPGIGPRLAERLAPLLRF